MANSQHIIKLNGKHYDALTGKALKPSDVSIAAKPHQTTVSHNGLKLVDGVRAPRKSMTAALLVGRTTEHSKTLMRTSVKKPLVIKQDMRVPKPAEAIKKSETVKASAPVSTIKPERLQRAAQTAKSALISKFALNRNFSSTDIVPVKSAPTHAHDAPPPVLVARSAATEIDRISTALEKANGHLQPKLKKIRGHHKLAAKLHISPTLLVGGLTGLFVLVVGGWLAYNNVPNIAMRIAATRAGIRAELPSYHPAGFSLKQPISYNSGEVNLDFTSNSDNRSYSVIQKASSWDSQALLENVIQEQPYQTIQSSGRTVYVYKNNAAWVDGGTFYQVVGNSNLSSDQLLKIANSL